MVKTYFYDLSDAFHSCSEGITYAVALTDMRDGRDVTERLFAVLPNARYDERKAYYVVDSVERVITYAMDLNAENPYIAVDYWALTEED